MLRVLLTTSYVLSHAAAAAACVTIVVMVPLVSMIIVALIGNDPGGPLFFPIFLLLLLVSGVALSAFFSTISAICDFARLRWQTPVWIPPVILFFAVFASCWLGGASARAAVVGLILGFAATLGFSMYWLAVSSVWFLPRLFVRFYTRTDEHA